MHYSRRFVYPTARVAYWAIKVPVTLIRPGDRLLYNGYFTYNYPVGFKFQSLPPAPTHFSRKITGVFYDDEWDVYVLKVRVWGIFRYTYRVEPGQMVWLSSFKAEARTEEEEEC